jgi:hypothetical protein
MKFNDYIFTRESQNTVMPLTHKIGNKLYIPIDTIGNFTVIELMIN